MSTAPQMTCFRLIANTPAITKMTATIPRTVVQHAAR
jgi:hypothetical protein